jgi:N-acetylglucosamine-6-phosphate deacetylase
MFGGERMILVSDSGRCAGREEGYQFDLGGQMAEIRGGVAKLVGTDTIACSAANLWQCLMNVIGWGIREEDAIRAATYNPACAISAQNDVGSIETGKQADFLVCAPDYSACRVFLAGKEIV